MQAAGDLDDLVLVLGGDDDAEWAEHLLGQPRSREEADRIVEATAKAVETVAAAL